MHFDYINPIAGQWRGGTLVYLLGSPVLMSVRRVVSARWHDIWFSKYIIITNQIEQEDHRFFRLLSCYVRCRGEFGQCPAWYHVPLLTHYFMSRPGVVNLLVRAAYRWTTFRGAIEILHLWGVGVLAYGVMLVLHGRSGFYMGARSMEHVGRTELRACLDYMFITVLSVNVRCSV